MGMRRFMCSFAMFAVSLALLAGPGSGSALASDWRLIGPDGGNVRCLSYDPSDPNRILLGTSSSQLFQSRDGGTSWTPFAHLGSADDLVIDHIVFDPTNPQTIYAAGWGLYHDDEGDVFRSDDGGATWRALVAVHGKSIRALAMAPGDHNTLVIGALDGVFRSKDAGASWERMTPENPDVMENHSSMRNFVSVAVDPQNPDVVYAGTRHLPWKTSDGGKNWHNLKDGILDDSDVFSIIVDPKTPSRVYASACSGIYKSDNGGDLFHRVQGLPHSAIRTRVLKQDPQRSSIVYAGTTGGMWKTLDGGAKWTLVTSSDVVVNDVLIDPRNPERVLIATDRGGVLVSNNGFANSKYQPSNRGFSHRMVGAVITDRKDPSRLYVGIVNDKTNGGLFTTDDLGKTWQQASKGLEERDVLSLQQAENGTIFAGTNHGIFYLASLSGSWQPATMIYGPVPAWQPKPPEPAPEPAPAKTSKSKTTAKAPVRKHVVAKKKEPVEVSIPIAIAPRVRSIEITDKAWYAATSDGLFISVDEGKKWYGTPVEGETDLVAANAYADGTLTLASVKRAFVSRDEGRTWSELTIPHYVTGLYDITMTPDSSIWLGAREGAVRSMDGGKTWAHIMSGLPASYILGVNYDEKAQRLLATAINSNGVFESVDGGKTWKKTAEASFSIRNAMGYQNLLLATSWHNGLLIQREQSEAAVSSPAVGAKSVVSKSQ